MFSFIILMILVMFFVGGRANAYLDPGTGSFFVQLIVAAIVSVSFSVKIYWSKIKFHFLHLSGKFFKRRQNGE